jgi:hypothetical protein
MVCDDEQDAAKNDDSIDPAGDAVKCEPPRFTAGVGRTLGFFHAE